VKRLIVFIILSVLPVCAGAQRIDPNSFGHEISFGSGLGTSLNSLTTETNPTFWINYSRYYTRHIGLRTGFQYMPSNLGVDGFYCAPVAMSLRTGMFDYSDYGYGAMLAVDALDAMLWNSDNILADMLAVFLLATLNRGELFFGLTPGLITGHDSIDTVWYSGIDGNTYYERQGIRKAGSLYCSADVGVNLSWRIWRFTLNMSPAFHWNFTGNYHIYSEREGIPYPQDTPVNWTFTLNMGLGWLF